MIPESEATVIDKAHGSISRIESSATAELHNNEADPLASDLVKPELRVYKHSMNVDDVIHFVLDPNTQSLPVLSPLYVLTKRPSRSAR